ncbi:uncharacterized protein LOC144084511 isoform X2 [Stigmatopora argus]
MNGRQRWTARTDGRDGRQGRTPGTDGRDRRRDQGTDGRDGRQGRTAGTDGRDRQRDQAITFPPPCGLLGVDGRHGLMDDRDRDNCACFTGTCKLGVLRPCRWC